MASKYYDDSGKEVFDGDVALASDLNTINSAIDSGFQVVESDLEDVLDDVELYSDLAEKWAENPENTAVEAGKYSALHWSAKATASASAASSSSSTATTQAGIATTKAGEALASKNTADADVLLTNADVILTHADVVLTHADVLLTHADVSTAAGSASTATTQAGIATDAATDVTNKVGVIADVNVVGNNLTAIQTALTTVNSAGGGEVILPVGNNIYEVTLTSVPIRIGSYTTLNLNGNTIHRTDTGNFPTFKNLGNGTTTNYEVNIINGLITSVGANGTVTDQGSAITLYNVDGYRIENIRTDNTTGDGITLRTAENGLLRNIRIGDYGRNGFSPDSGSAVIDNFIVEGTAFTGANPGLAIDVETDAIDEFGDWIFNGVKAERILLIDQFTATNGKFGIKAKYSNCTFGPHNTPFYIKSTNKTLSAEVVLDSTNTLIVSSGYAATGFTSWNVGGFTIDRSFMKHDEAITPDAQTQGILIAGIVEEANIIFPRIASTFSHTLWSYSTNRINNSVIKMSDFQGVYLGGASNILTGDKAGTITIDGVDTISNTFDIAESYTRAIGISGTASWDNQFLGSARGKVAESFYSREYSVPLGASHDLLVPLPLQGAGRAVLVSAAFSSAGLATEWGNVLQLVVYGASAQSARTAINSAGVGVTISIVTVAATYIIVRVAHTNAGVLSVCVLG